MRRRANPFGGGRNPLRGTPIRITKYRANCIRCGAELTVYPRHIEHKEPIVCPSCGRRNSADEFDFSDQIAAEREALRGILGQKGGQRD